MLQAGAPKANFFFFFSIGKTECVFSHRIKAAFTVFLS